MSRFRGFVPVPPAGAIPLVPAWRLSTEGEDKKEVTEMAIKKGENIYRPVGIHIDLTDDEDDYILVGEFPAGHELTPGERLEGIPTTRVELSLEDRDALIAAAKASPVFAEGYGVIAAHPEFADAEPGEA